MKRIEGRTLRTYRSSKDLERRLGEVRNEECVTNRYCNLNVVHDWKVSTKEMAKILIACGAEVLEQIGCQRPFDFEKVTTEK
ncbi:hypothetical protein F2Q68_00006242 [Brassica cretica]|uniref:Uncharacterized protein n=1 Tax=Brassica cretica TaxID=69181 RepID=A0A8S9JH40_BRACR|nr:hypothetical protein F2Q68_00006242 [Brassica cretica]